MAEFSQQPILLTPRHGVQAVRRNNSVFVPESLFQLCSEETKEMLELITSYHRTINVVNKGESAMVKHVCVCADQSDCRILTTCGSQSPSQHRHALGVALGSMSDAALVPFEEWPRSMFSPKPASAETLARVEARAREMRCSEGPVWPSSHPIHRSAKQGNGVVCSKDHLDITIKWDVRKKVINDRYRTRYLYESAAEGEGFLRRAFLAANENPGDVRIMKLDTNLNHPAHHAKFLKFYLVFRAGAGSGGGGGGDAAWTRSSELVLEVFLVGRANQAALDRQKVHRIYRVVRLVEFATGETPDDLYQLRAGDPVSVNPRSAAGGGGGGGQGGSSSSSCRASLDGATAARFGRILAAGRDGTFRVRYVPGSEEESGVARGRIERTRKNRRGLDTVADVQVWRLQSHAKAMESLRELLNDAKTKSLKYPDGLL